MIEQSTPIKTSITAWCQQVHQHPGATWLVTLNIPAHLHGLIGAYPQSWAVADDFGNLAFVTGWT